MASELVKRLSKYLAQQKDRLASSVPSKHASREKQFRQYIQNEIKSVETQLEQLRLQQENKK